VIFAGHAWRSYIVEGLLELRLVGKVRHCGDSKALAQVCHTMQGIHIVTHWDLVAQSEVCH
jgi:hypothetical protein